MLRITSIVQEELMTCLSRFGCRVVPAQVIEQTAFLTKPAAGIALIHSGIPDSHRQFWLGKSQAGVQKIYEQLTLTPKKVASLFSFPEYTSKQESHVCGYVLLMVGNMQIEHLRRFMRFVTGSSAGQITVTFNGLSGLGRRPIAYTCDCSLELPSYFEEDPKRMMSIRGGI